MAHPLDSDLSSQVQHYAAVKKVGVPDFIRLMARFFKVGGGFAYELQAGPLEQIYDTKVTHIICMQQDRFTQ